ncbi:MAG: hypothetical protein QM519_01405 [Bacteroidia bacterium]|nr:hypothetical protein [Bacteroidia bacterium]
MPFGDTPGLAVGLGRPDFMMPQGELITSSLSNKGNATGFGQDNTFRVLDQQAIRLVDNKGNLLFSGSGPEAAKQAVALGQDITDAKGNKAAWSIQTGDQYVNTDGSVGTRWNDVAREKKNNSPIGTILDISLPILANALLPGSGFLSTMAGAGLGSAASGAIQGKPIGDILKSAGISAATAGLMQQTGLDKVINQAVGSIPVVGDVAKGVSKVVGSIPEIGGAGALSKAIGDEIIVNALNPVASSLASGALSSSLANSIANKYPSYTPPTAQSPLLQQTPPETSGLDALSEIDVTGTRIPNLPFVAPTTKLFNNAQYSGGENVRDTQPTEQEEKFKDGEEIIVTGSKTPPITFPVGSLAGSIKDFAVDKYGKYEPTEPLTEKDPETGEDEIVVTAKDQPFLLPGVAGALATSTKPEFTQNPAETQPTEKSTADKISDYLRLAGLGLGLVGNIGGGGGGAGTGRYNTGKGALNPIFSAKLPTTGTAGSFTVGGLGGTAGGTDPLAARPTADWYRYATGRAMDLPEDVDLLEATSPYAGFGPGTLGEETFKEVTGMSHGGPMGYSRGSSRESFAVEGPGTGRSDDIPAVLSDGEYVIDAETVALLGDGSSRAGAKKLDELRVKVRKHKGKNLAQGKFSVNAKHPEAYMLGGRI